MFPIPWNKEYRKKDGTLVKISDAMSGGGGGSDLPPHSSSDAGKVLTVGESGNLEWDEAGSGGGDVFTAQLLPVIEPRTNDVRICVSQLPLKTGEGSSSPSYKFSGSYALTDAFVPENYEYMEFYGDLRASDVTALNLTLLAEELSNAVREVVLSESISNFDAILIQGCYDSSGVSSYDTTIVYSNPQINTSYWFGMKDRNSSYSGTVTFSDGTHGTLSVARRLKIYGFNL